MRRQILNSAIWSLLFMSSGCDPVPFSPLHVLAPNVTPEHLQEMQFLTGIPLPDGTNGLEYHRVIWRGSMMYGKASIPDEHAEEFRNREIFLDNYFNDVKWIPELDEKWWKRTDMTDRIDASLTGPTSGALRQVSIGREGNAWVVYLRYQSL